ncbi:MAG: mechanosensitive ion channel protein MscS, partial [Bacteroidota bacterium]|nr:mechanosensitive ion channel protein MscS [Bacteroidota bacterium]
MIDPMSFKSEILFTIVLLAIIIALNSLSKRAIRRFGRTSSIDMNSRKIIFYLSNLLFYLLAFIGISLIWGVNLEDFSVF